MLDNKLKDERKQEKNRIKNNQSSTSKDKNTSLNKTTAISKPNPPSQSLLQNAVKDKRGIPRIQSATSQGRSMRDKNNNKTRKFRAEDYSIEQSEKESINIELD